MRKQVVLTPLKGHLSRKMDFFSENDTFILFYFGAGNDKRQQQITTTKQNMQVPVWDDQRFTFFEQGDNLLKIEIYDEDQVTKQIIGSGAIDLSPYFTSNRTVQKSVSITYQNKPAGKVLLRIQPQNYASSYMVRNSPILTDENNFQQYFYNPQKHHKYVYDLQKQGNMLANDDKKSPQQQPGGYSYGLNGQMLKNMVSTSMTNANSNLSPNSNPSPNQYTYPQYQYNGRAETAPKLKYFPQQNKQIARTKSHLNSSPAPLNQYNQNQNQNQHQYPIHNLQSSANRLRTQSSSYQHQPLHKSYHQPANQSHQQYQQYQQPAQYQYQNGMVGNSRLVPVSYTKSQVSERVYRSPSAIAANTNMNMNANGGYYTNPYSQPRQAITASPQAWKQPIALQYRPLNANPQQQYPAKTAANPTIAINPIPVQQATNLNMNMNMNSRYSYSNANNSNNNNKTMSLLRQPQIGNIQYRRSGQSANQVVYFSRY